MNILLGLRCLLLHWKTLVIILVPLLFLPLVLQPYKESKCGYVVIIIAVFWMTEAVPLPITSLLPVVLFPLLGILSTEDVCVAYLKETTMMFLGGLIIAIAVEHSNLHRRIALKVLLLVGSSPRRLMLGFMITTMFLSMWISNTASTAMMAPIAKAVLRELEQNSSTENKTSSVSELKRVSCNGEIMDKQSKISDDRKPPSKEEVCYFLGIAYAANIGGTGTITGTGTNLTLKGLFESIFPEAEGLNFAEWMAFNVPLMLLNGTLAWIWLQLLFLDPCRYADTFRKKSRVDNSREKSGAVKEVIEKNFRELGPMSFHEGSVLFMFLLVVFLWFFRNPEFITGWADIYDDVEIDDATAAMTVVFLLFLFPANLDFLKKGNSNRSPTPALLNWKVVHEKVPWGLVLLLGGGFAMAAATKASGLSRYMGQQLVSLEVLPPIAMLIIICLATTFLTEISSNTAVANILLPVLAEMSTAIRIHPLYLMLPATLSCSYAFMLPVATPANAIVVAASNIRTFDMLKAGIGMNLICCAALVVSFSFFGVPLYDLNRFPDYAMAPAHNATA